MSSKDDVEKEFASWRTVRPSPGTGEKVLGPAFAALGLEREPFAEETPARKNAKMGFKRPTRIEAIEQSVLRFVRGLAICTCVVLGLRVSVQLMGTFGFVTTLDDVQQKEQQIAALAKREAFTADRKECDRILRLYTAALIVKSNRYGKIPALDTLDEEKVTKLKTLLNDNQDALSLIEQAGNRSFDLTKGDIPYHDHSKRDRRYGQVGNNSFSKLRYLSRLLQGKALIEHREGRRKEMWRSIKQNLRLAEYVYIDRILINDMVAQAMVRTTVRTLDMLAQKDIPSPSQETIAYLQSYDPIEQLKLSLIGESRFCSRFLRKIVTFSDDVIDGSLFFGLTMKSVVGKTFIWLVSPILAIDIGYYQKIVSEVLNTFSEAKTPNQLWVKMRNRTYDIPFYCHLTSLAVPNYKAAVKKTMETKIAVDMTLIRLARASQVKSFTKLEQLPLDLVPQKNQIDPFSGKPYLVKTTADDTTVYSVGPNGKDDGGKGDDITK
jgi:hypothetical protein